MASWSDVGAGEGSHGHHDGGANFDDDVGHGGDPWQDHNGGQDLPAGEGEGEHGSSVAGWSWTNNGKGGSDGLHDRDPSVGSQDLGSSSSRRRRGKRGSGGRQLQQQPRWRSGQVPQPPEFDGDVETNPFCLRHYRRALRRWVRITKEFLPPNEQALRALDAMRGSAALEFEEVDDDRYDMENGIEILLADLEKNFGEKEIFRRGGVIREYETLTRVQGESITAFIRRFRLVERKLQDAQVAPYPDESRAIKFLDGLRLDEKTTSHILLAAGNKYNFQAILDAVRMQFPAGLTLTGMARPGATLSSSSSAPVKRGRGGRGKGRGWKLAYKSWNANEADEGGGQSEHGEDDGHETCETAEHYEDEGFYDTYENEADPNGYIDVIYENDDAEAVDNAEEIEPEGQATQEILTATSKQMAGQKAARGYYDVSNKGKGKKSSKDGKNNKGRGSSPATYGYQQTKGKDSNKGKNKSGNEHKGKGYDGGGKSQRQIRFANSQCLGCGSTKHFLRDCPNVTTYQAHLASALAPGSLTESGEFQSWMVSGSGYGGASGSGDRPQLTGEEMRARSRSRDGSPPDDDDPAGGGDGASSGSTGPYVDQLPHVFSETDLFATDFQYTNVLHDVAFRRIIRDFDRSVQPRQGQCTPDRPHGHWVCPATLIDWKFDPEVVVNLTQPSPEWLSLHWIHQISSLPVQEHLVGETWWWFTVGSSWVEQVYYDYRLGWWGELSRYLWHCEVQGCDPFLHCRVFGTIHNSSPSRSVHSHDQLCPVQQEEDVAELDLLWWDAENGEQTSTNGDTRQRWRARSWGGDLYGFWSFCTDVQTTKSYQFALQCGWTLLHDPGHRLSKTSCRQRMAQGSSRAFGSATSSWISRES